MSQSNDRTVRAFSLHLPPECAKAATSDDLAVDDPPLRSKWGPPTQRQPALVGLFDSFIPVMAFHLDLAGVDGVGWEGVRAKQCFLVGLSARDILPPYECSPYHQSYSEETTPEQTTEDLSPNSRLMICVPVGRPNW